MIVDAMSSFGGVDIPVGGWGIDDTFDLFISLYDILDSFADFTCDNRIIHSIQMNAVRIIGQQIDNLAQSIGHSCIKQSGFVILKFVNDPLKTLRKRSTAHCNHTLDLGRIDNRHNPGNNRNIDIGDSAIFHKTVELCIVKE